MKHFLVGCKTGEASITTRYNRTLLRIPCPRKSFIYRDLATLEVPQMQYRIFSNKGPRSFVCLQ